MPLTQVQGGMLAGSTNTTTTIQSNGTTAITIDSSQNVGIGTASPDTKLSVFSSVSGNGDATRNVLILSSNSANTGVGGGISFGGYYNGTSALINDFSGIQGFKENATSNNYSGALRFTTRVNGGSPTERMRIASDGAVLINRTSPANSERLAVLGNVGSQCMSMTSPITGAYDMCNIINGNGQVGLIQTNGSGTSYITSSDYRLKENVAPMTGALAKVALLKPCTYTWKIDGSNGQGFIAHELQAVVPDAVSGEKDAVETYTDEDGNEQTKIKPQGVDTSFLVATLTAAIQELNAKVEAQAAEIAALKAVK